MTKFRRSSHCDAGSCVTVANGYWDWSRSSFCSDNSCVEVRRVEDTIEMRNSEDPDTVLTFTLNEWAAFLAGVEDGEFPA
jgi:hypothetical protein